MILAQIHFGVIFIEVFVMRQAIIPDNQIATTVKTRKVKHRERAYGFLDHDFTQFAP